MSVVAAIVVLSHHSIPVRIYKCTYIYNINGHVCASGAAAELEELHVSVCVLIYV